jgi:hemerythrin superfamily protein
MKDGAALCRPDCLFIDPLTGNKARGAEIRPMDIYTKLQGEHVDIMRLLEALDATEREQADERRRLITELRPMLLGHAKAEEAVVYRRLDETGELKVRMVEARAEHGLAEKVLEELHTSDPGQMTWKTKLLALKKAVEHHIKMEEGAVFDTARKVIPEEEAQRLTDLFDQEKTRVLATL